MTNLKCGCKVTEEGKFVLGENCKINRCRECNVLTEIHPFGEKKLSDFCS